MAFEEVKNLVNQALNLAKDVAGSATDYAGDWLMLTQTIANTIHNLHPEMSPEEVVDKTEIIVRELMNKVEGL